MSSLRHGWSAAAIFKVSLRPGVRGRVQARPGYYAPADRR
jgi:hypothetical protein